MNKEELEFCEEWLALKKYYFKLLTMVTVLADNNKAFRGRLSELCTHLNIQNSSGNIQKIKEALTFLAANDYIKVIEDKNIYTVSLAKSAQKSKKIIKIKKTWYKLIRENKSEASWENTLKIFLVLLELDSTNIIKYADIEKITGIKSRTIQNCVKAVSNIDFGDFKILPQKHTHKKEDGSFCTEGQTFEKVLIFE